MIDLIASQPFIYLIRCRPVFHSMRRNWPVKNENFKLINNYGKI